MNNDGPPEKKQKEILKSYNRYGDFYMEVSK